MQVNFNAAELAEVLKCMEEADTKWIELQSRLQSIADDAEELESIDLNDCGDSCKL